MHHAHVQKDAAKAELQRFIDAALVGRRNLLVLDAGCGGATHLRLPSDISVIGIDISPESARRNGTIKEIVLGDIQTYQFPEQTFDVIVCWEVLEHVDDPLMALSRLLKAVKVGSVLT